MRIVQGAKRGLRRDAAPVPPIDVPKVSDYRQKMQPAMIHQVRSFNRTVMTAIGALDDRFLGRSRPMGEARLLWEVGRDGAEVRELRARLGLDSGYVSRLLRSLAVSYTHLTLPTN